MTFDLNDVLATIDHPTEESDLAFGVRDLALQEFNTVIQQADLFLHENDMTTSSIAKSLKF